MRKNLKLRYIDALRGIAILAVIVTHTDQYGTNIYPKLIKNLLGYGSMGVQLFYLVSAFTLFLSFNRRKEVEAKPNRNFFIRRFFRIAPMYYLGIAYFLFQKGLSPGTTEFISTANIISNVFFLHGTSPYWITNLVPGGWTIAVEMMFYSTVPFLFHKISNTNQAVRFTILCLVCSFLLRLILLRFPAISDEVLWNSFLFYYFPNQVVLFGLGIIAYFLIIKKDTQVSTLHYIIIGGILIVHLVSPYIPTHFLFGLAFLGLMLFLSRTENKLFVNPVTLFLGNISYSAYLVHFAVLFWLQRLHFVDYIAIYGLKSGLLNFAIRLALVLTLTSTIAWLFMKCIEQPFQKWGKKIIEGWERKG